MNPLRVSAYEDVLHGCHVCVLQRANSRARCRALHSNTRARRRFNSERSRNARGSTRVNKHLLNPR